SRAKERLKEVSGEGGIRTLGRIAPTPVFETGPIGHSGTSPVEVIIGAEQEGEKAGTRRFPDCTVRGTRLPLPHSTTGCDDERRSDRLVGEPWRADTTRGKISPSLGNGESTWPTTPPSPPGSPCSARGTPPPPSPCGSATSPTWWRSRAAGCTAS